MAMIWEAAPPPSPEILVTEDRYGYDSLNRLTSVQEYQNGATLTGTQQYSYDHYGNRTINPASTLGLNKQFTVNTATNQLGVPSGQPGQLTYDNAGNLTRDTYTSAGDRVYDADNRITATQDYVGGWSYYTYNANGQRVRRKINNQETWQIYGIDGELVAEYAANGAPGTPQKEYGYRNGQLLVTAQPGGAQQGTQNVSWTNAVGVSVNGNSLTKTASTAWANGGASSSQTIASGDGYVEFTASETTTSRMIGLSNGDANQDYTDIDFAAYLDSYNLCVYEAGVARGCYSTFVAGDLIRVAVESGVVKYKKNGVVFYTSTVAPNYPLLVDTALWNNSATLNSAVISGNLASSGGVRWLVTDQLGTPRIIIDQTGAPTNVKRHDYLPFGEEIYAGTGGRTTGMGCAAGDGVRTAVH